MSFDIEANKKIVEQYFKAQESGDLNEGLKLFADDAVWWIPGDWEMAGTFDMVQIRKLVEGVNQFDSLSFKFYSITAEENRVAALTQVNGNLKDGRVYQNHVFFLFEIADGKIQRISEVVDSLKSKQFWLGG